VEFPYLTENMRLLTHFPLDTYPSLYVGVSLRTYIGSTPQTVVEKMWVSEVSGDSGDFGKHVYSRHFVSPKELEATQQEVARFNEDPVMGWITLAQDISRERVREAQFEINYQRKQMEIYIEIFEAAGDLATKVFESRNND